MSKTLTKGRFFIEPVTQPCKNKESATETQTNNILPKHITRVEVMETKVEMYCMKGRGQTQQASHIPNRSPVARSTTTAPNPFTNF